MFLFICQLPITSLHVRGLFSSLASEQCLPPSCNIYSIHCCNQWTAPDIWPLIFGLWHFLHRFPGSCKSMPLKALSAIYIPKQNRMVAVTQLHIYCSSYYLHCQNVLTKSMSCRTLCTSHLVLKLHNRVSSLTILLTITLQSVCVFWRNFFFRWVTVTS